LPDRWGFRHVGRVLGRDRLRRFLISVFPAVWDKLPAQGGVRYYVEAKPGEKKWQGEVEKAMRLARLVIVQLGTTPSLAWEMERIEQLRLSGKTLFVTPPLILKKNYRARWQQFTDFLCATRRHDRRPLDEVNPKRVLAVIVREDTLVIITARRNSAPFYESTLDVAAILAVADPAQSAKLIPKYLK